MVYAKYRVYCETEAGYVFTPTFENAQPTDCPNDAGHTVRAPSWASVKKAGNVNPLIKTAPPGVNDDGPAGCAPGDRWTDTTNDKEYTLLDDTPGAAVWKETTVPTGGGNQADLTASWDSFLATSSTAYVAIGDFIFGGTAALGNPTGATALAGTTTAGTGKCRIYDVTNSQVICESAAFGDMDPALIDLGVMSNLPAGKAIWELQIKQVSGGNPDKFHADSVAVRF